MRINTKLARPARLLAGLALAGAMSVSGFGTALADSTDTTGGPSDGLQHFMACLALLGNSAQHAQECGPSTYVPDNTGLSVPFNRTGCSSVGMLDPAVGAEVKVASLGSDFDDSSPIAAQHAPLLAKRACGCASVEGLPDLGGTDVASLGNGFEDFGIKEFKAGKTTKLATPCPI